MRVLLGGCGADTEVTEALPPDTVIFTANTMAECVESVYACAPDMLIVERNLPELWSGLQQISAVLPVPAIMVGDTDDPLEPPVPLETIDLYGYLARPVTANNLRQMLAITHSLFQRLHATQQETALLRDAFASRKLIDRAKGTIMERQRLSEADAYAYLRDESRRQRIPIVELAKSVLGQLDQLPAMKKMRSPGTPAGDNTSWPARQHTALK